MAEFLQASHLKYLFRPNYNLPGRFNRPNGDLYTEIIKYSDILKRAQLRNQILMEKLDEVPEANTPETSGNKKKNSKRKK